MGMYEIDKLKSPKLPEGLNPDTLTQNQINKAMKVMAAERIEEIRNTNGDRIVPEVEYNKDPHMSDNDWLCKRVAKMMNIPPVIVKQVMQTHFGAIAEAMKSERIVNIREFGWFTYDRNKAQKIIETCEKRVIKYQKEVDAPGKTPEEYRLWERKLNTAKKMIVEITARNEIYDQKADEDAKKQEKARKRRAPRLAKAKKTWANREHLKFDPDEDEEELE